MRQTGAIIDTLERLQRGHAKRASFISGHHWSRPHPVVDVLDRDIRAQSATAATRARRMHTGSMKRGSVSDVHSIINGDAVGGDDHHRIDNDQLADPDEELFLLH